ncbi:MAG: AAA family ATPase [Acidobacteriota bacterium]
MTFTLPSDQPRQPELDHITVQGFRSLAEVNELALRPINLLIGANGSGKSNFIGVFAFLNAVREGRLQEYVERAGGAERILHFGKKTTNTMRLEVSFKGGLNRYAVSFRATDNDALLSADEVVYFWDRKLHPDRPFNRTLSRIGHEAGISEPSDEVSRWVSDRLGRWRLYHFHDTSRSSPMKTVDALHDNQFLRPDASNLAAFLYLLRERHAASYRLIQRTVARVAPFFKDFQLEPSALQPDKLRLEWQHRHSDAYFDAASLSDGSLRFIALATLFLQPVELRPSVIVVDEPELGLHPFAITLLASLIKQASTETQVILSTQSSLLLDHFEPEDVLVAEQIAGATTFRRLDSASLEEWLADYSLGQLWEKNELGGRPGGA